MTVVEKKMGGITPEFQFQNSKNCLEALFVFHSTVIHQDRSPVEALQSPSYYCPTHALSLPLLRWLHQEELVITALYLCYQIVNKAVRFFMRIGKNCSRLKRKLQSGISQRWEFLYHFRGDTFSHHKICQNTMC